MQNVLRSLARNISTQVSNSTLEGDVKNNSDDDISRPTLTDYSYIRDDGIYVVSIGTLKD